MGSFSPRPHVFFAIAVSALLLASCGDDTTKPEETGYPPATTFDQLIKNFKTAYWQMNDEEYRKLLDESFQFLFDPRDITQENWFKERYGRDDEMASIERIFRGEPDSENRVVFSIQIAFEIGEPGVSPDDENWTKVTLSNFELEVRLTETGTGQEWMLVTGGGGYEVDLHGSEVETDPPLWKIMQVVDRPPTTVGGAPGQQTTLGAIKAAFHPDAITLPGAITLDQLLADFHAAMTQMDYRKYASLLDSSYEFVFDPRDINEENGWKERWSEAEDLASAVRMFAREPDSKNRIAQNIGMGFVAGDPIDSDEGEEWKKVVLSRFELEIEAIQADNGETWFLRTKGGYEVDLFAKLIDGDLAVWKIVRIVDRPPSMGFAGQAIEETTWGSIKTLY